MNAKSLKAPLGPGATIGILGGGQLGRMLALAAARLGLKTHIYSDESESCGFLVAGSSTRGGYHDHDKLEEFAATCDVVTFEFENVPDATAEFLAARVPVAPGSRALKIAQDRLFEKDFISGLGIATASYRAVSDEAELVEAFRHLRAPAVLKTRRLGYDGKGQQIVRREEEAMLAFSSLGGVPCILEQFIDFEFEASVVAARACDGKFAAYDPPKNEHENHVLRRSTVPAPMSAEKISHAIAIAMKIADALDYVGVLGVELFVSDNGHIAVNEIAPRVHNSGHWTIDACHVSQFEQHIRAIAGWPLGDPARHSDAVMENILGREVERWNAYAERGGGLHIYGKRVARPGRKMGHITTISPRLSL